MTKSSLFGVIQVSGRLKILISVCYLNHVLSLNSHLAADLKAMAYKP